MISHSSTDSDDEPTSNACFHVFYLCVARISSQHSSNRNVEHPKPLNGMSWYEDDRQLARRTSLSRCILVYCQVTPLHWISTETENVACCRETLNYSDCRRPKLLAMPSRQGPLLHHLNQYLSFQSSKRHANDVTSSRNPSQCLERLSNASRSS